jgi:hypothetical protein
MTAKTATTREGRIAGLAHRIWEEEGRPTGRDEQHWLRAAGVVDAELAKPAVTPRTRAPVKKPTPKKARKT